MEILFVLFLLGFFYVAFKIGFRLGDFIWDDIIMGGKNKDKEKK